MNLIDINRRGGVMTYGAKRCLPWEGEVVER